jgi:2-polyprenyl-3-methyl-5-hydroxy-6-metoxy-1,4-benzoquinol methylase
MLEGEFRLQKERVVEAYRRWAPRIGTHHEDRFHMVSQGLTARTLEAFLFELPRDTPILDAGGGDGQWSLFLAKQGFTNVLLGDISPELLEVARQWARSEGLLGSITVERMDIETDAPTSEFGVVLCLGGVLSHCLDHKKALKNLYASLRQRGTAVISVDSYFEAKATAQFVRDQVEKELLLTQGISRWFFGSRLPYYTKYFRRQELADDMVECGFKLRRVQSRPQEIAWDLGARFFDNDELARAVAEEERLAARPELLDLGYQLEFVLGK